MADISVVGIGNIIMQDEGFGVRCAVTDNGDELYWNVKEDGIEIIIYASRYSDIEVFNMSTTEFLYKLLSKDLICLIFPDYFLIDSNYYEL